MATTEAASHRLPKAELHVHVEGAAPPALVARLAERHGLDLEGVFDDQGRYRWEDFTGFLHAYDRAASVFRTPEDYAVLSETYLKEIAADGAIYAELTISPDHAAGAGLSYVDYVAGLAEGIGRARAETGIEARMIAVGVRHFGARAVEQVASQVIAAPHPLVTGFGLAGDEREGHERGGERQREEGELQVAHPERRAARAVLEQPFHQRAREAREHAQPHLARGLGV